MKFASKQVTWARGLLSELGEDITLPTRIFENDQAANHVLQSCSPIMFSNHVLQSCSPIIFSNRVLQSCSLIIFSNHILQSCSPTIFHKRKEHIMMKITHLQEQVKERIIIWHSIATLLNIADMLTKALCRLRFLEARDRLRLEGPRRL